MERRKKEKQKEESMGKDVAYQIHASGQVINAG